MTEVERLLSQYIAEHRAGGEADPLAYIDRVEGTDRAELVELIDAYLASSPGREWDPQAYEGSAAEQLTDRLMRSLGGESGLWPVVLPRMRERARVMREDLVTRLADALGVGDRREKVEGYYHQMEQGLLPSEAVSPTVLERLGEILGTSAETLRESGRSLGGGAVAGQASPAFTRLRAAEADAGEGLAAAPAPPERGEELPAEWDEVDRLFRGGAG